MNYPKIQLAQTIIQLCKLYDIKHVVISPGSRNAPLTLGFYEDSFFKLYSIVDERCAAFFALGIAQQINETVALVCTSGSALLNYYPAISEAYYSDIPLVVISADRPANKIDIGDGQTIRQNNVFSNHILHSVQLDESENQLDQNEKKINSALEVAISQKGPVHINAPFEEPLYELTTTLDVFPKKIKNIENVRPPIDPTFFVNQWNSSKKKMVLVGVNAPNTISKALINWLAQDPSVIVLTETTSNLHHDNFFPAIDKIIAPIEYITTEISKLQPDLLLTFGGMVISKKIKAFLRKYSPKNHFHIDEKKAYNTFFNLKDHFKTTPNAFFELIVNKVNQVSSTYREHWLSTKENRKIKHNQYLKQTSFSDFLAYDTLLRSIPNDYNLQLSNSSTVRYSQLFDLNSTVKVFCNRGTSGIDGSTSTAIGASIVTKNPTLLITGDLSFFYDSNALWNSYIPENFRIIVLNNGGGGIFRILPGPKNTENFKTYFETKHELNARSLCEMYTINYSSVTNKAALDIALKYFFLDDTKPKLLEIFTPSEMNDKILIDYFNYLNDNS